MALLRNVERESSTCSNPERNWLQVHAVENSNGPAEKISLSPRSSNGPPADRTRAAEADGKRASAETFL